MFSYYRKTEKNNWLLKKLEQFYKLLKTQIFPPEYADIPHFTRTVAPPCLLVWRRESDRETTHSQIQSGVRFQNQVRSFVRVSVRLGEGVNFMNFQSQKIYKQRLDFSSSFACVILYDIVLYLVWLVECKKFLAIILILFNCKNRRKHSVY